MKIGKNNHMASKFAIQITIELYIGYFTRIIIFTEVYNSKIHSLLLPLSIQEKNYHLHWNLICHSFCDWQVLLGFEAYYLRDWVTLQIAAMVPWIVLVPIFWVFVPESPR